MQSLTEFANRATTLLLFYFNYSMEKKNASDNNDSEHGKNWYLGSKPKTNEDRIEKMKQMWRECMEKNKEEKEAHMKRDGHSTD